VRTNASGRPLSYYIRTGDGDKYAEVQSPDLIVLAERDRPDELRSISRLVTCLTLLQDRDEILDHEVQGVKRAGAIGLALEGAGSTGFFGPETTSDEGLTTDKILGGGAIWNLPAGKTLKEIKNDRPGPNLQDFMDQILRAAAAGLGLPYEYLWKADLSGPSQRFVLAQAQRRFDEVAQALTTQMISRVRLWALAKAIKRGDLTPPRGMDRWWTAVYHTPQRTTIDAGRDSAAEREDLKLGLTTMASIYASRGEDWQEAVDQKISEAVYIREKAAAAGLAVSDVQFIPQQPQAPAAVTPPSAPQADEAPAQTPAPELAAPTITVTMTEPVAIEPDLPLTKTETFSMKDDMDLHLTDKELDMVVKAVGLKNKKAKKSKAG
jgi:capsid protein